MKITRVSWKNFGAFSNRMQELVLPEGANTILVAGPNGSGKSSIAEIITYGIYGKVKDKNLKELVNRVTGNGLYVKIELESRGHIVVIERGTAPSVLDLKIDGKTYDKAGKKSVQEFIEDDVLGMPFHVFSNAISVNVDDFTSFLRMSAADKRKIVDRIFGLSIINEMREQTKDEMKRIKEAIDSLTKESGFLQTSIEKSERDLEALRSKVSNQNDEQIALLTEKLAELRESQTKLQKKAEQVAAAEAQVNDDLKFYRDTIAKQKEVITVFTEKLALYENDRCPTCAGNIHTEEHKEWAKTYQQLLDHNREMVEVNKVKYADVQQRQKQVAEQNNKVHAVRSKIQTNIEHLNRQLRELRSTEIDDQTATVEKMITDQRARLTEVKVTLRKSEAKQVRMKALDDMLGEQGVKQKAISSIMPKFNQSVQKLAVDVGFPYQIRFDEEFNAQLRQGNMEVPVRTLSTGQNVRIDIAVILSIVKLMKVKFPNINFMFLDEVMSSVDSEGRAQLLALLRDHTKSLGMSVAIVNHSEMPLELFDYRIDLSLVGGFSQMRMEKIG